MGQWGLTYPNKKEKLINMKILSLMTPQIYKDFSSWMADIPAVDYGVNTQAAVDALRGGMQSYFDGAMSLDDMLTEAENTYKMQVGE